ncbi:hypothetical protein F4811DRAFT_283117 [Daldinia bambusicola]|nr:hypothetical protein F4811DRAFT_283117 [Daldinia bambusicola]
MNSGIGWQVAMVTFGVWLRFNALSIAIDTLQLVLSRQCEKKVTFLPCYRLSYPYSHGVTQAYRLMRNPFALIPDMCAREHCMYCMNYLHRDVHLSTQCLERHVIAQLGDSTPYSIPYLVIRIGARPIGWLVKKSPYVAYVCRLRIAGVGALELL